MRLHDTLEQRKARGQAVDALAPFDATARQAVTFTICRALDSFAYIEGAKSTIHHIFLDIVEFVYGGQEPSGPNSTQAAALARSRINPGTKGIRAYILDAPTDLAALDATAVVLRHMSRIVKEAEEMWSALEDWHRETIDAMKVAITRVNDRLDVLNIGYHFDGTDLIRSSEPTLLKGAVEPCLKALHAEPKFRDTENEFRRALEAWKKKDYKQAVHHSGEAVEGMLRVLVQEIVPAKYSKELQVPASVDLLTPKKIWAQQYGDIMKKLHALRGDRGAHSEATKPEDGRATEKDAEATVYLAATMLVYLARAYDDHQQKAAT